MRIKETMFSGVALMPLAAILLAIPCAATAQDAGKFFEDNCAMCHSIGGTPQGAPDLKDVTKRRDRDWLARFIADPEAMAKSDKTAAELVKQWDNTVMPATEGLTPHMTHELLEYLDRRSAGGHAVNAEAGPPAAALPTPEDVSAGRSLFAGGTHLTRGGPSCVSCHRLNDGSRIGGGTMGPDLTAAAKRLGGVDGVNRWLANPPTRVMRAVFRPTPLDAAETRALAALLADTAEHRSAAPSSNAAFFGAGAAGAALALLAFGAVWTRRFRNVRRAVVAQVRTEARDE